MHTGKATTVNVADPMNVYQSLGTLPFLLTRGLPSGTLFILSGKGRAWMLQQKWESLPSVPPGATCAILNEPRHDYSAQPPKLLDQLRRTVRRLGYSPRTERAYFACTRRYVRFHDLRHPSEMGRKDIQRFLEHLAADGGDG